MDAALQMPQIDSVKQYTFYWRALWGGTFDQFPPPIVISEAKAKAIQTNVANMTEIIYLYE